MNASLLSNASQPVVRDSIVVASSEQISSNMGGEVVLLNLRDEQYYGLDAIGARVWELIQQSAAVAAVCDTLMREYAVEAEQCERDVLELLAALEHAGLVEVNDASGD